MNTGEVCRVAIYARVSTEEQAEHGYSIDAQLETLRQYCQQTEKKIAGEYVDRGVSGKEMTKRHELKRLLRDAENRAFDEVVVWKINRMSRKTRDLLEIVDRLNKQNIYFRSYSENFETETPMGRFALQMMGAVGELERNTIVENVKLGLKQRARMGYWNGGSVLGYRSVETAESSRKGKKTRREIVPEEAIIIRKIFELYASGRGMRSIANQLNHEGYKTKKGNTFSCHAIKEIILNPVYVGIVRYNRFENWSEKRRRGKNPNPILEKGRHEPIIEEELWEKVQELYRLKSKVNPRLYIGISLLTGLIRCPQCGSMMIASRTVNYLKDGTKKVRRYYSCSKFRNQGSAVCHANSLQADYAEKYVLERIREVLNTPKILEDIVTVMNRKRCDGVGPMEQELEQIESRLKSLAQKKKKLKEIYELDAIDQETLTARMDELLTEEDALYARKSEITYELGGEIPKQVSLEKVKELMGRLDELLEKSPPEKTKLLLHAVIKEITIKERRQIDQIILCFDQGTQKNLNTEDPSGPEKPDGSSFTSTFSVII